jgi:phage-related tail fiber protein
MSAQYYTLVTDIGLAKLANALALGQVITLTHFAVGDGNGAAYDPVQSATALKREVYRAPINTILTDPATPTWLTIEAVIPATVGGWTVREAGVFDVDGDLIVIAKYPESVKPALDSGVGKDLYCRLILEHGNVSAVTLKIDPAVVLATHKHVADAVAAGIAEHKAAEGAHPDASTTVKGFVELATPTETKTGTDTVRAVTPKGLSDTLNDRLAALNPPKPGYDIPWLAGYAADMSGQDLAVQTYGRVLLARAITLQGISATLGVAATGAALILDVARNGTTIWTTKPMFATGASALTAGVLDPAKTACVAGDVLTFAVSQVGSTIRGQQLTVTLKGVEA